jgi:hypothetical protein
MSTPSTQNNPLIGIWKLISATAIHADGTVTPDVYGTHPVGYITSDQSLVTGLSSAEIISDLLHFWLAKKLCDSPR